MTKEKPMESGFAGINYRSTSGKVLHNNFINVPEKNESKNK